MFSAFCALANGNNSSEHWIIKVLIQLWLIVSGHPIRGCFFTIFGCLDRKDPTIQNKLESNSLSNILSSRDEKNDTTASNTLEKDSDITTVVPEDFSEYDLEFDSEEAYEEIEDYTTTMIPETTTMIPETTTMKPKRRTKKRRTSITTKIPKPTTKEPKVYEITDDDDLNAKFSRGGSSALSLLLFG